MIHNPSYPMTGCAGARALVAPGLWLQRITTREPSDDQLEIALLALERALAREEGHPRSADGVAVYPDFQGALAA